MHKISLVHLSKEFARLPNTSTSGLLLQRHTLDLGFVMVEIFAEFLTLIALGWGMTGPTPEQLGTEPPLPSALSSPTLTLKDTVETMYHLKPNWFIRMVQRTSCGPCRAWAYLRRKPS
jgi:hypothetical protein